MAIKVTFGEVKPQEEKPFPKLMISNDGDIFYMVRERYGLPLTNADGLGWTYELDDFANFDSNHRTFTDYNEPITLQNE